MKNMMVLSAGVLRSSKMSKGVVCIFMCLAMLSILGCLGIIKDNLPAGASKGYVRFYRMKSDPGTICPEIYSVDEKNKESVLEGGIPWPGIWFDRGVLQLARTPGIYHFTVSLGTAEKDVHVKIEEGMMTPVRVIFSDVKKSSSTSGRVTTITTTFKMDIAIDSPIPVSDKSKKHLLNVK